MRTMSPLYQLLRAGELDTLDELAASSHTMDPDRVELLERRCARLERMIGILQRGNLDSKRRIAALESGGKPAPKGNKAPDLVDYETYCANGGRPFGDQDERLERDETTDTYDEARQDGLLAEVEAQS